MLDNSQDITALQSKQLDKTMILNEKNILSNAHCVKYLPKFRISFNHIRKSI